MRLGLITDIHEDHESLLNILKKIRSEGYDKLACLGDISGYNASHYHYGSTRNAQACLDLVRENCGFIIPGNHDMHVAGRIPQHASTFSFPPDWFELDPGTRKELSGDLLWPHEDDMDPGYSIDSLNFIRSLPEYVVIETGVHNILLSHYCFPNFSGFTRGFYTRENEFREHFEFMKDRECDINFTGHAHPGGFYVVCPDRFRQYTYRSLTLKKNPVILGLPPVSRYKQRSGYCIFDTDTHRVMVQK